MFSKGKRSITLNDVLKKTSEIELAGKYLGINKLPITIRSPFRQDNRPSFGLYSTDGKKVYYKDFSTGEHGSIIDLLSRLWGCSFNQTVTNIDEEKPLGDTISFKFSVSIKVRTKRKENDNDFLRVKIRDWNKKDIEYWESYGVPRKWLNFAEVYPISHKMFTIGGNMFTFKADKLAYAFVERRNKNIYMKIYQPLNTKGFKWTSSCNGGVISLWNKIPKKGKLLVICSSLKDALCLWANTGIPSIALQGEGYHMDKTTVEELKSRFDDVIICFDNDAVGIACSNKLSQDTGFRQVILEHFCEGKDISDLFKAQGKKALKAFAHTHIIATCAKERLNV